MKDSLDMLFSRLLGASGMTRESAVKCIADLLMSDSVTVSHRLMNWISSQELESNAAYGILPFVYSKVLYGNRNLPETNTWKTLTLKRSILSDYLLTHLYDEEFNSSDKYDFSNDRTDDELAGTIPNPEFDYFNGIIIPPIFASAISRWSSLTGCDLESRWEIEWLDIKHNIGYDRAESIFSYRGYEDRDHLETYFCTLTEVYRSAILRAISWAVSTKWINTIITKEASELLCPVNLSFSQLSPIESPTYWPTPSISLEDKAIDTLPGEIISHISEVIEKQVESSSEYLTVFASGRILETEKVAYDVTITSFIQRAVGPERPTSNEIASWENNTGFTLHDQPALKMDKEPLANRIRSDERVALRFSDWLCFPLLKKYTIQGHPSWKLWLMMKGFRIVNPIFIDDECNIEFTSKYINLWSNSEVISRCSYWPINFCERTNANLGPSANQQTEIRRTILDSILEQGSAALCHLITLKIYTRKYSSEKYTVERLHHLIGGTTIIQA